MVTHVEVPLPRCNRCQDPPLHTAALWIDLIQSQGLFFCLLKLLFTLEIEWTVLQCYLLSLGAISRFISRLVISPPYWVYCTDVV